MKTTLLTTALMISCAAFQTTGALEMTATAKDVREADPQINVTAQNAAVIAAISKVNRDVVSILRCNKQNRFYKPNDSTADSNGCVGISVQTTTKNESVSLPTVSFNSYSGQTKSKKGYIGSSTRTIDLSSLVADGAKAISVTGSLSGFDGGCAAVKGAKTWNIANVNSSVGFTEYQCHYDSSPNRSTYFGWSYNASNKTITVRARMVQTHKPMTGAKISGIKATYSVTKTVLKISDGK